MVLIYAARVSSSTNTSALADAHAALLDGKIVACPTDTLIGLCVDIRAEDALAKLFKLKGRAADQHFPLLAPDIHHVEAIASDWSDAHARLAETFWPGPITLIVKTETITSPFVCRDGTVAVRVPTTSPAGELVRRFGAFVTATSANRSGQPAVNDTADLDPAIRAGCSVVIEGASRATKPSTIVSVLPSGEPHILREGQIPKQQLLGTR